MIFELEPKEMDKFFQELRRFIWCNLKGMHFPNPMSKTWTHIFRVLKMFYFMRKKWTIKNLEF